MIGLDLSPRDLEAIQQVSTELGLAFVTNAHPRLMALAEDPRVSPLTLPLGIIDAHVKGLASALVTLDDAPRAQIIRRLPAAVIAIINEGSKG